MGTGRNPKDCGKGLILRLPKKGDLSNCNNWRGTVLLSVSSKIFCRILLKRIDKAMDTALTEEQMGFRKRQGCTDQIFAPPYFMEHP